MDDKVKVRVSDSQTQSVVYAVRMLQIGYIRWSNTGARPRPLTHNTSNSPQRYYIFLECARKKRKKCRFVAHFSLFFEISKYLYLEKTRLSYKKENRRRKQQRNKPKKHVRIWRGYRKRPQIPMRIRCRREKLR